MYLSMFGVIVNVTTHILAGSMLQDIKTVDVLQKTERGAIGDVL